MVTSAELSPRIPTDNPVNMGKLPVEYTLSRADRRALFYKRLSQHVLAHAGVEVDEIGEPPTDTPLRPEGIRQRLATRRAVKLGNQLLEARHAIELDNSARETIENAMRAGKKNWVPVTKAQAEREKNVVKGKVKFGEIEPFEAKHALEHVGHYHTEHHAIHRKLTAAEREQPLPLNVAEKERIEKLQELTEKAKKIGAKGKPELWENISESLTNWDKKLDIDRVVDVRSQMEDHIDHAFDIAVEDAETDGLELDEKHTFNAIQEYFYATIVPDYLGIGQEDFDGFVSQRRKKQLRDLFIDKSWDELDALQDAKHQNEDEED